MLTGALRSPSVTTWVPAGSRTRAIEMLEGSVRQVRSSACSVTSEPIPTNSEASADAAAWSPPPRALLLNPCCTTARDPARIAARSMICGMSSFRRRRAIRSTLVIGASSSERAPSSCRRVGAKPGAAPVITGNASATSTEPLTVGTGSANWRDCSAGAAPVSTTNSTSVRPSGGAATRSSSPLSAASSSGWPGCSSIARR